MEACPDAGIIQTQPRCVGRDTLHARIQQFANAAYGPMFAAGVHFWQLGEALYWGHNAIIRVDPFVKLCALGKLPNDEEVLSHDFVEAALMRRAGWGVWIAYDLEGSYEEVPTNLIEELQRDARWCHGNMLNARFVLARGLQSSQRGVFVSGVMSYFSAPLWFCFLMISTALLAINILVVPDYFFASRPTVSAMAAIQTARSDCLVYCHGVFAVRAESVKPDPDWLTRRR